MTEDFVAVLNAIDERIISAPPEDWELRYLELSQLERDLYDVNCFNFEYVGGGLTTYFRNSAGAHWRQTLEALERVGASEALDALREACSLFPQGSPSANPTELERQASDPALLARIRAIADFDDGALMTKLESYWRNSRPFSDPL